MLTLNSLLVPHVPWFGILVGALVGACFGSFLNVLVYRLPKMALAREQSRLRRSQGFFDDRPVFNLALPLSSCPHCGHGIRWYENIPVLSWLCLRGRCSGCSQPISVRYPLIECLGILMGGVLAYCYGAGFMALAGIVYVTAAVAVAMIAYDRHTIPFSLLAFMWLSGLGFSGLWNGDIKAALWLGSALLWLIASAAPLSGVVRHMVYLIAASIPWMGMDDTATAVLIAAMVLPAVGLAYRAITFRKKDSRYEPVENEHAHEWLQPSVALGASLVIVVLSGGLF